MMLASTLVDAQGERHDEDMMMLYTRAHVPTWARACHVIVPSSPFALDSPKGGRNHLGATVRTHGNTEMMTRVYPCA
jgi:hypothetical protein